MRHADRVIANLVELDGVELADPGAVESFASALYALPWYFVSLDWRQVPHQVVHWQDLDAASAASPFGGASHVLMLLANPDVGLLFERDAFFGELDSVQGVITQRVYFCPAVQTPNGLKWLPYIGEYNAGDTFILADFPQWETN